MNLLLDTADKLTDARLALENAKQLSDDLMTGFFDIYSPTLEDSHKIMLNFKRNRTINHMLLDYLHQAVSVVNDLYDQYQELCKK